MPDARVEKVLQFYTEQHASRLHIFTVVTPFSVSQDRLILVEHGKTAQLIVGMGCTPRTAFEHGDWRDVDLDALRVFVDGVARVDAAFQADAVPPNVHDGVTITIERATDAGYARVRVVSPAPDSPHERLIAAWTDAFPEARKLLR